jgi:hypothetical protein
MFFGILQFNGGHSIYQGKQYDGGDPTGKIQKTWWRFKIVSTELVPAHIGIGIGRAGYSFGGSPKNFKLMRKMGSLFITFGLPRGDMLTTCHPPPERQRLNVERRFFS